MIYLDLYSLSEQDLWTSTVSQIRSVQFAAMVHYQYYYYSLHWKFVETSWFDF